MTLSSRIWLAAGILAVAVAVQGGLLAHMALGPSNAYPTLTKPFAEMPATLAVDRIGQSPLVWNLQTLPRPKLPFEPLDVMYRRLHSPELNLDAQWYAVHAENGEDRKHHPEVCIRDVQQVPEDPAGRAIVFLGGDPKRPVQCFCFQSGPSRKTTVYYWHYSFVPRTQEDQTWLQSLYQTFSRNPPSVTVQVTTTADRDRWPLIEQTLLTTLDQQLRAEHLPDVIMRCDRLPIGVEPK